MAAAALTLAATLLVLTMRVWGAPVTRPPPYWAAASCLGLSAPDDDELVRHSLVVLTPTLAVDPALHAPTETLMNFFFSTLAHDLALKYCPRVALETSSSASNTAPHPSVFPLETAAGEEGVLPQEMYDCDILVGDVPYGVSRAYTQSKQPMHALVMADPVESTVADFRRAVSDPAHPRHKILTNTTLHAAILQTAALAPAEQAQAGLLLNPVTWRLCGPGCHPSSMSLDEALAKATANMNTRTILVLSEHSVVWGDLVRLAAAHRGEAGARALSSASSSSNAITENLKRFNANSGPSGLVNQFDVAARRRLLFAPPRTPLTRDLSPAEISILENANHADRVLYGLVQAREEDQRRCMRGARVAAHRRFRL